ncbi:DMT family transporter [Rathayibacter sp. VKM Ac-2760]|uniref:DMT family transporter n=1 Tax=Rathayibacter sp. VKM Ac-2760 TaxID=2609253 RepID=UPI00131939C8|nr:DMT family transporter [Rathayibacter sp. VKM Ac-2760]QHC59876.1 EamA family transporter [Rathayibacter sp. VKM Ac-2760]
MTRTAHAPADSTQRGAVLLWSAIAVTVLLWASAFVGIRYAAPDFGPGALTLGRIVVGSIALTTVRLVITARRSGERPERSRVPRGRILLLVLVWGVAWFGLYNLALNAAERHVDAGTAALLVNIAPMITALLAGLLLGEGFPRRLLGGMAVALAGVAVIAFSTSSGQFDVIGVVLGLAAAVLYGGAATLQKRLLAHVDAMTMTWIGCLAATVACLPFAPELLASLADAPAASIAAVVYLGVFPTAVAFTTWGYVLSRTSAGRTAATTYAVPAVVVLLSWLLLSETPPAAALIGGAIALGGVAVATLRRRPAGV